MSIGEQPCYTLINLPSDSEPPNEMQLKQDLGELSECLNILCCRLLHWLTVTTQLT